MELRDLLTEVELQVKKARHCFDYVDAGGCRKHLVNLLDILNEQLVIGANGSSESDEPSGGS